MKWLKVDKVISKCDECVYKLEKCTKYESMRYRCIHPLIIAVIIDNVIDDITKLPSWCPLEDVVEL